MKILTYWAISWDLLGGEETVEQTMRKTFILENPHVFGMYLQNDWKVIPCKKSPVQISHTPLFGLSRTKHILSIRIYQESIIDIKTSCRQH